MTADLATFLLERLDEEHEVAEREYAYPNGTPRDWSDKAGEADSMLVGIFSPARVLADVEAKRRIIEQHPLDDEGFCGDGIGLVGCKWAWPCPTLRLLALPYVGHEAYREEWRP